VICRKEELRPDDCVPCELSDLAASVRVLWELPDSVHRVRDHYRLSTGPALHLHPSILPARRAGWLRELP